MGSILREIYKNRKVVYEVNAAVKTGYYEDERVLLKDLLYPDFSPLYKSKSFIESTAAKGIFKQAFFNQLSKGEYPNLKTALGTGALNRVTNDGPDSTMEIFSNANGVSIYFPYSDNFPGINPADANNNTVYGNLITIVNADREADSGPGGEPYVCSSNPYEPVSEDNQSICYRTVTVDDNYAERTATHIVGIGAEPARIASSDPPAGTAINRVYHGWSRLTRQLDKLISFSDNGGGSEMKVGRISGYLQMQNQQVTNFAGDIISINYTRKEITKKNWKRVYGVWDPDWKTDNLEQVYASWEDDTQGTKTFSGSLGTTVTISQGNTATGNIGFNVQVSTQDELVTQRKQDRYSYFRDAKNDQGWGFQMCHPRWCGYDDTFLPSGSHWPKYDEGTIWGFTWSYKTF